MLAYLSQLPRQYYETGLINMLGLHARRCQVRESWQAIVGHLNLCSSDVIVLSQLIDGLVFGRFSLLSFFTFQLVFSLGIHIFLPGGFGDFRVFLRNNSELAAGSLHGVS